MYQDKIESTREIEDFGRNITVPCFYIKIGIPFTGDASLWDRRPSHCQNIVPIGHIIVDRGKLSGTVEFSEGPFSPDENSVDATKNILRRKIDNTLQCLKWYIERQKGGNR